MENNEEGRDFQPSTIETIDMAMHNHIVNLNLHVQTSNGFIPVPILWVGAERSFQLKNDLSLRDKEGLLNLPIITIERKEIVKDQTKSRIPSNIPDSHYGGLIPVKRRIVQDKTNVFISAQNIKKSGANDDVGGIQEKIPFSRNINQKPVASMFDTRPKSTKAKIVYETTYIPIPVYINVKYEVQIKTGYQQHQNTLLTPFISANSNLGRNHKYFTLTYDNHFFEGFIDGNFASDNNGATLNEDERIFNTTINIDVLGYLIGGSENENMNMFRKVESIVEIKIPRERVIIQETINRKNYSGTDPFYKD